MNTKIALLLILGIVVFAVLSIIIVTQNKSMKDKTTQDTSNKGVTRSQKAVIKDGVQNDAKNPVGSISYKGESFAPAVITVKKGQNIEVKNLTDKKIDMKISGPVEYKMPIEANKDILSPLLTESGAYLIYDSTNSAVKAQLLVTE